MAKLLALFVLGHALASVSSVSITEIQGTAFKSPLAGELVHNVTGTVASNGFYLVGPKSDDVRASNGLFIFTSSAPRVTVGDAVSLSGRVTEFRQAANPNYLFLTELTSPSNIVTLSSNNTITPVILGRDRSPPTRHFSALDVGPDGFLSVPNNSSLIEATNATLRPDRFGLDFWESLEGQLVTIPRPTATGFQNNFGDFWTYGSWPVTGRNSRGGLSLTFGPDGIPDGNPEVIDIGSPLDGTKNPQVAIGVQLSDITGVVTYQFGFYYVLPLTAPTVISRPSSAVNPTRLVSNRSPADACTITFGDYNVENLSPGSAHLPTIARHIVDYLRTPDLLFLQEIQDDSGPTDDGTVSANLTLSTLANAIQSFSGVKYSFTLVNPVDGQDGGQPGGNIRTAYMFRPEVLTLARSPAVGGPLDKVEVGGSRGRPSLNFNPGRIDPTHEIWNATRKPLVAHFETRHGQALFAVNIHLSSKGGSSSTQGDARPPVNSPIENRTGQINSIAGFVGDVIQRDSSANIIVAGDFNEFIQARSAYKPITRYLTDIDEAANIPQEERYSYIFDQNSQQLDHAMISSAIRRRRVEFEHVHLNTWAPTLAERISDHDPSVGRIRLC
ncbi:endonuclease/exonuclease/phosphatase [Coprinopsis marcescibilis]|uniref:Endonuclease/exonuclease/phosphatase n=1 Tax=Coprinopsis marcescibilis TaxID=230819 RepID=A0A5C3LHJ7_COPMA|nr:endonuclease/exonuclease/phosphatase [Coprinopsis marcescibilis]